MVEFCANEFIFFFCCARNRDKTKNFIAINYYLRVISVPACQESQNLSEKGKTENNFVAFIWMWGERIIDIFAVLEKLTFVAALFKTEWQSKWSVSFWAKKVVCWNESVENTRKQKEKTIKKYILSTRRDNWNVCLIYYMYIMSSFSLIQQRNDSLFHFIFCSYLFHHFLFFLQSFAGCVFTQ